MATTSIHPIRVTEAKSIQYITNPEKAERITCYGCKGSAEDISHQFDMLRAYGKNTGSVLSYHIIQSFAPNETTAEQVHQAGLMLCDKLFQDKYKYVLSTHSDTKHIHNHIIFCKTNMENYKAFGTLMDTKRNPAWKKIRQLSDEVCKEMGLSVVEYGEIGKGVSHYEWSKQQQGSSWKAQLRYELDCIIQRCDTFEEFLEKCRLNGIEVVYNPDKPVSLKFRMQGQQRYARAKTLGYYYLPENIQLRIEQFSSHRKMIIDRDKFDNKGLQYWADIQNMKNVAQMINMLESYNVRSTSELKPTAMTVMARRGMITQSIENLDDKINDLSKQIELIRQFQRSKPYHDKYKSLSAWKQKDYAKKNAPVLGEYKSVGSRLKSLYHDGKFPSETSLDRQRQALYEEREKLYEEYRYLKKEYADLDKASQTIDDYLASLRDEPEHGRKKGELE